MSLTTVASSSPFYTELRFWLLIIFSIILPLLPFYALQFNLSPEMIGLLTSVYSVCQFVAAPLLGSLSDRYGRRPVLILVDKI